MQATRAPALVHLLALVSVTTSGASISAQHNESYFNQAIAAIERVEYEAAYELLHEALRSGGRNPAELALLYRKLGEVAATLERKNEARRHFERSLTLWPGAILDEGESPKIVALFDQARDRLEPLELSVEQAASRASKSVISISVVRDKLGLITAVIAANQPAQEIGTELVVDVSGQVTAGSAINIEFLDKHGNVIAQRQFRSALNLASGPSRNEQPALDQSAIPAAKVPLWRNPLLWMGLAGAAGATTTLFGLRARRSQRRVDALRNDSNNQTYEAYLDALGTLEARARQTNVAIGVTALTAAGLATSIVWWLTDRKRESETTASVGVAPGEISVVISTHY